MECYLLSFSEEFLLRFARFLFLFEEIVFNFADIYSLNVNMSAGSHCVNLVDSSKRNSIDLVGSGHKEET